MHEELDDMQIKGLTLTELMTAMAIAAIVTSMAIPTFSITMARSHIVTKTNEFLGYLNYARNEAITRGRQVVLCKSEDATDCATGSIGWEQGFIVFVDMNNNNGREIDETLLRERTKFDSNLTITGNSTVEDYIAYSSDGRIRPAQEGKLSICDKAHKLKNAILISKVGRARSDAKCKSCPGVLGNIECAQCTAECQE